jgi:hypothetical protein
MNNIKEVITFEGCEECSTSKGFSVEDLFDLDLFYSYDFTTNEVTYQGSWDCKCGYTNFTLGQAELL